SSLEFRCGDTRVIASIVAKPTDRSISVVRHAPSWSVFKRKVAQTKNHASEGRSSGVVQVRRSAPCADHGSHHVRGRVPLRLRLPCTDGAAECGGCGVADG